MKKIEISKEIIEEVIRKYRYKRDACEYLNITIDTLNRILRDYGMDYPRIGPRKSGVFIKSHPEIDKQ